MTIVHNNQDIFGDTVRGGYGGEDDDEWVTVPVNLIPGQMNKMMTKMMTETMMIAIEDDDDDQDDNDDQKDDDDHE